jgi:ABC-type multidrug transport system ATPase subunit
VVDHGRVIARGTPDELKRDLGSTVIEIGLADEDQAGRAQALLARLASAEPEREGTSIRMASTDGPQLLVEVLRSLDSNGLAPSSLSVREPSLDDVFLALTGRHAEEGAQPDQELTPAGGSR